MRKGDPIHCYETATRPDAGGHPGLIVRVESPSLLQLSGVLDLATRDLLDVVLSGLPGGDVHLDVARLEFADAAGLAILAAADDERRRGRKGRVVLHRPQSIVERALMAAGLGRLLPRHPPAGADTDWRRLAACIDAPVEMFFDGSDPSPARRLCWSCPVSGNCLSYALKTSETFGIWGGLTARERAVLQGRPVISAVRSSR
jgi:WhiB family redox-sensing transcriptional regulator